jgi:hypothetical protein
MRLWLRGLGGRCSRLLGKLRCGKMDSYPFFVDKKARDIDYWMCIDIAQEAVDFLKRKARSAMSIQTWYKA